MKNITNEINEMVDNGITEVIPEVIPEVVPEKSGGVLDTALKVGVVVAAGYGLYKLGKVAVKGVKKLIKARKDAKEAKESLNGETEAIDVEDFVEEDSE